MNSHLLAVEGYAERPLLLDTYCCAGGAAKGYYDAGFRVIGIDNDPRPLRHYPFPNLCADALETLARLSTGEHLVFSDGNAYGLENIAAIHASPPCQFASEATPMAARSRHPNLIPETRQLLQVVGLPYIIENVDNASRYLENPIRLCGSMFGLRSWRHRWFELGGWWCLSPATCLHFGSPVSVNPGSNARKKQGRRNHEREQEAMGIDWMGPDELSNAIQPVYTRSIGASLMAYLRQEHHA